jgi:hypothetical protein
MEQDARLRHRSSFGAAAVAYAEHRPDYAQAAVRWALEPAPGRRVLDLGAGTGKLTRDRRYLMTSADPGCSIKSSTLNNGRRIVCVTERPTMPISRRLCRSSGLGIGSVGCSSSINWEDGAVDESRGG